MVDTELQPEPRPAEPDRPATLGVTGPTSPDRWVTGIVVTAFTLAASWLIAEIVDVDPPLVAVGTRVIDASPRWLKEFAISVFGTSDKLALEVGTFVLLVLAARWLAGGAVRRFDLAALGIVGLAAVGLVCGRWSIDGAAVIWPNLAGAAAGVVSLRWLTAHSLGRAVDDGVGGPGPKPGAADRVPAAQPIPRTRGEVTIDRRSFVARVAVVSGSCCNGSHRRGHRWQRQLRSARAGP